MSVDKYKDKKVTIKIPRILYNKLSTIVSDSGFNSVTDFIIYVLRDLLSTSSSLNISVKNERIFYPKKKSMLSANALNHLVICRIVYSSKYKADNK